MFTKSLVTGRSDAKSTSFSNIGVADRRGEICIGLSAGSSWDEFQLNVFFCFTFNILNVSHFTFLHCLSKKHDDVLK